MKKSRHTLLYSAALALLLIGCSKSDGDYASDIGANGRGGSMARFALAGDYLYTVDQNTLHTLRLDDPARPEYLESKDQRLGFDIETVWAADTLLFIGSQSGMYIYDIARPEFPQELSRVSHFTSCDPVVAAGGYAYVTLSGSSVCRWGENELQVYDIAELTDLRLVYTDRNVVEPKGLGIDEAAARLFVCIAGGLKVYDLATPERPQWCDDLTGIPEARDIDTYDCIPMDGLLLVIGADGLYQFDYTGERIAFVSKIDLRDSRL